MYEEVEKKIKELKILEEQMLNKVDKLKDQILELTNEKKKIESGVEDIQEEVKKILIENGLKRAYNYQIREKTKNVYDDDKIIEDDRFSDCVKVVKTFNKVKGKKYLDVLRAEGLLKVEPDGYTLFHLADSQIIGDGDFDQL